MRRIICLVGHSASGKSTATKILSEIGFTSYSLSDEVRDYAHHVGLVNPTRSDLQKIANQARLRFGAEYFAHRVLRKVYSKDGNYVLDGIRNVKELEVIKAVSTDVYLIATIAPYELRLRRIQLRGSQEDIDEFWENELRESGMNGDEYGQQNNMCMNLADYELDSDCSIPIYKERLMKFLFSIGYLDNELKLNDK